MTELLSLPSGTLEVSVVQMMQRCGSKLCFPFSTFSYLERTLWISKRWEWGILMKCVQHMVQVHDFGLFKYYYPSWKFIKKNLGVIFSVNSLNLIWATYFSIVHKIKWHVFKTLAFYSKGSCNVCSEHFKRKLVILIFRISQVTVVPFIFKQHSNWVSTAC